MAFRRKFLVGSILAAVAAVAVLALSRSRAQTAATQPAAVISPQGQQMLNQVRDAYSSLKSLAVAGTVEGHFNIDGARSDNSGTFTGLYSSSGLFRSEMKDTSSNGSATTQPSGDALIGNTGDKI